MIQLIVQKERRTRISTLLLLYFGWKTTQSYREDGKESNPEAKSVFTVELSVIASCEGEDNLKIWKRRKSREQCGLQGVGVYVDDKNQSVYKKSCTGVVHKFCTQFLT